MLSFLPWWRARNHPKVNSARAPRPAPTPIPALAPVDNPELEGVLFVSVPAVTLVVVVSILEAESVVIVGLVEASGVLLVVGEETTVLDETGLILEELSVLDKTEVLEELGVLDKTAILEVKGKPAPGSAMMKTDEEICSDVELGSTPLGKNRKTQIRVWESSAAGIVTVQGIDSTEATSKPAGRAVSIQYLMSSHLSRFVESSQAILCSSRLLEALVTQRSTEVGLQSGQY